ncbi:eukaryotic translation initiation factor 5 [Galendromus occidentalis]|uniref:Eukaryotic translation initiation factor 5 n=1 Tax=Galendromus occidentalis TaxID=34638 RepID=A0AAJ6QY40_9ACAR|nr:eukaryotic translation initiation factor 5 [Galendromus occidentalis]
MTNINVNRSLNDQFYRYKMPKLIAKVEGKGNGIKTVIVNMTDIAKALSRPPAYPTKYFGCELGSQTHCDAKSDRFIVNGQHDANKLQEILDGFIKRYVLCASCDNPETVLTVLQKRGIITTACKACGHSGQLETNHKLNTFILKNPPEGTNVKAKDAKTPKKDKKKKDDASPNNSAEENDAGDIKHADALNDADFGDDFDEDWIEDTSTEAMKRRMQELSVGAKSLMLDADTDKSEEERSTIFFKFVKDRMPITSEQYKAILAEASRLEIKDKASMILCELILNNDAVKLIKAHAQLFVQFSRDNRRAQKYLLGAIEQSIKLHKDTLLPKTAIILKTLYDFDIVDEESLIEWSKKVSKRFVGKDFAQLIHNEAQPFIDWLQNAEEESEDEDSGEDAVEIEYDDRHTAEGLREVKETTPKPNGNTVNNNGKAPPADEDDGDDLDIDDI